MMQIFSADATLSFLKNTFFLAHDNVEKPPSKDAHNRPQFFFSVLPTGPKPAQIPISVP